MKEEMNFIEKHIQICNRLWFVNISLVICYCIALALTFVVITCKRNKCEYSITLLPKKEICGDKK